MKYQNRIFHQEPACSLHPACIYQPTLLGSLCLITIDDWCVDTYLLYVKISWIKLKNISAKMFLPRVPWRRGILHAGALEDPGGQVRVRDHLRARGVRGLQAHRHPRPRHPSLPRHQDQEGAVLGQGGSSGTKIRHGTDVWQTFYNEMLYLYHARLLLF